MRLFIAVDVGDAVRDEVARVTSLIDDALAATPTPPRVTWVSRAAVHLTVRFLGDVSEVDAPRVQTLLSAPIHMAPFEVEWQGLGAFPSPRRPRALWIGVGHGAIELGRLQSDVSRRIDRVEVDAEPFRPHLTLGRVRTPGVGVNWAKILRRISVRGVRSHVERVTLYRSTLSPRGPNYTEMAHAALGPARAGQATGAEGDR
ncbi:MAG: RNA 2',3'-cyclic phosphodiesterase [Vicinamibacterales bacterium]